MIRSADIFRIAGIYDASIGEGYNLVKFYGYNRELWPSIWHKIFDTEIDFPIRLDALFFEEIGTISHSAIHPSLPLFLTIYEHNKQVILISYEIEKRFGHAGYFFEEEKILEVYWLSYLPFFIILTESNALKIIGPDIKPIAGDINSFSSMLSYSMNTHTRYLWKYYYNKKVEERNVKGLLHIHTFNKADLYEYNELAMLFTESDMALCSISIGNAEDQKGLEINLKIKEIASIDKPLRAKYLLKPPKTPNDSFKVALQFHKVISIYTLEEKNVTKTREITLPEDLELVRVNSYQVPIITIMNKAKIIKVYADTGKYIGFINLLEVNNTFNKGTILKADLLFYHNANIQGMILLLNNKMVLLNNKHMYESDLDLMVVSVLARSVNYCLDLPIIKLEQTSNDSIILCTSRKGYLVYKKAIKEDNKSISLKVKLHLFNEVYPVYHPSLLREYLGFGDIGKLQMILLHLYDELKIYEEKGRKDKVLTFLGIPVIDILTRPKEQKKSSIQAISHTNDMFESFLEEERYSPPKIIAKDKRNEEEDYERLMNVNHELMEMIKSSPCLALNESERTELISLLTNLKDFVGYQKAEDDITQEFLLHMNLSNVHWSLGNKTPISTMDIALAYHCQNQDWLLKILLEPLGNYCWEDIKRFGIPLWLRDSQKLKEIVEQVAIEEYKRSKARDADRVNEVSLWYIMMGKKNVLTNLYKHTQQGRKVYDFLCHNFEEEKWKKAASRNAYQLFSQKRYVMAGAFYLLGRWINEAVQVATTHLRDLDLAVTICRLMGEEEELKKIYKEFYISKGIAYGDPWLASLGNWLCGNYIESLNCIDDVLVHEEPIITDEMNPQLNLFNREDGIRRRKMTDEWSFDSPLLTGFNDSLTVLFRKLEKHYLVLVL